MKLFIKHVAITYVIIYALSAFVSWDFGVLAHASESERFAYVLGGLFFSVIGFIAHVTTFDEQ